MIEVDEGKEGREMLKERENNDGKTKEIRIKKTTVKKGKKERKKDDKN